MNARVEQVDPFGRVDTNDTSDKICATDMTTAVTQPLDQVRADITNLDQRIVALLAERIDMAKRTTRPKQALGSGVYDPAREAAVVREAAERAGQLGLDTEGIRELFWRIVRMSRDAQEIGA